MFKPLSLAQYGKCYYRFFGESVAIADTMLHRKSISLKEKLGCTLSFIFINYTVCFDAFIVARMMCDK